MRGCFAEADTLEDVLLRRHMWCFSGRCLVMFCWSRCFRGCTTFRKNVSVILQRVRGALALDRFAMLHWPLLMTLLHCYTLQPLTGLCLSWLCRDKHTKGLFMVLWLVLAASMDSCQLSEPLSFFWTEPQYCRQDWTVVTDSCLLFWPELLIILTTKIEPKELFRSTPPVSY